MSSSSSSSSGGGAIRTVCLHNGHGSVVSFADDTGSQVGVSMVYDPDGEILAGDVNKTVHLWNDAAGLVYNPDFGQYESGGGVYDPVQGRGITPWLHGADDQLFYYATYEDEKKEKDKNRIELEGDIPDTSPECPCIGDDHDCHIELRFLKKGDSVVTNYTRRGGTAPEDRTSSEPRVYDWLSDTHKKSGGSGKGRLFHERFPVIITLKSKTKDVRNCHLRQDMIDFWKKRQDGEVIKNKVNNRDYSKSTTTGMTTYGGWWIHDAPRLNYESNRTATRVYTHWFFQAHVFVEENEEIEMYWGGQVHADFDKEGAEKNAIVERKPFGPLTEKKDIPYLSDQ